MFQYCQINFNFYIQSEMERINIIQKKNTNKCQTYICQQRQNLTVDNVPMLSQLENTILDIFFFEFNFYNQSEMEKIDNI